MTDSKQGGEMEGSWIDARSRLPAPGQPITAEIRFAYGRSVGEVLGVAHDDPSIVVFDFWSGTAGEQIIRWKPRIPSGEPGHPWTSIERGQTLPPPPKD